MAIQEEFPMLDIWGPKFDEYSRRMFDPRISGTQSKDIKIFYHKLNVCPLDAVENSLCKCDPRIGTAGLMDLNSVTYTLFTYLPESGSRYVFENYYGFLCIRHLLHITCLCVLRGTNSLDQLLESLDQNAGWGDLAQAVASKALDTATSGVASTEEICRIIVSSSFVTYPDGREDCYLLLITLLGPDRGRLIELYLSGMLPGFSLFLLAIWKSLPSDPEKAYAGIMFLQDLSLRLYLVGPHQDRQLLQPVCMRTLQKIPILTSKFKYFEESDGQQLTHTMFQAYPRLLLGWRQDLSKAEEIPIDLICPVAVYVLLAVPLNGSHAEGAIETARTSLQVLWLLFERSGRIPVADHSKLRPYAAFIFGYLKVIHENVISTKRDQYRFAQMLADVEIVGLLGRFSLLVLDEGNEFQNLEHADTMYETLLDLRHPIYRSTSVAPELFHDSAIEWVKVVAQLGSCAALDGIDLRHKDRNSLATNCVLCILRIWNILAGALTIGDLVPLTIKTAGDRQNKKPATTIYVRVSSTLLQSSQFHYMVRIYGGTWLSALSGW
ncbi:hypothetical protein FRC08_006276 [Ceratobasidium sp. 394]|nr:hypothetical protein FRC08_006276 [Ceratobasidium sp. 394]